EVLIIARIVVAGTASAQHVGSSFPADPAKPFDILTDWDGFNPIDTPRARLMLDGNGSTASVAFRFTVLPGQNHWIALTVLQADIHLDPIKIARFTGPSRKSTTGQVRARYDLFVKVDADNTVVVMSAEPGDDLLMKNLGDISLATDTRADLDEKVLGLWSRDW